MVYNRWRLIAMLGSALLAASTAAAPRGRIAITVDDLPIYGREARPAEAADITNTLLGGFTRRRWPVTGFVNEGQLDGPDHEARVDLLRRWLDAGMSLGNHGYSHLSLTSTPVDRYIADVARGDAVTAPLMVAHGRHERWFRYPYLETGPTMAVRRRFEHWLAHNGYRVAPVTMENADWQFGDVYDDAVLRGDQSAANRVRDAYLAYTAKIVPWYRRAAKDLLGREPAFILLLHASRLNAASIDGIAAILIANRLRPVTLEQAMRDRAYRIPDRYAGPDGNEWLTRWAMTLHRSLPYASLPAVPPPIVTAEKQLTAAHPDPSRQASP